MDSQLQRYARRIIEEQLGFSKLHLAQIADDISFIKTQQDNDKFEGGDAAFRKPLVTRFKIRIYGVHDCSVNPRALPWAYPPTLTSGLRGECLGLPMLPRGTFVYVRRDIQSSEYFIERVCPNLKADLPVLPEGDLCFSQPSGFDPSNTAYPVDDINWKPGNSLVAGNEISGVNFESHADALQDKSGETNIFLPTLDSSKNTISGMAKALEQAVKDVEAVRRVIGSASSNILRQSEDTADDIKRAIRGVTEAMEKQIRIISGFMLNMISKMMTSMMRKLNVVSNIKTGALPGSGKFANNDIINMAMEVFGCIFSNMKIQIPGLVSDGLFNIMPKIVNVTDCLIDSFVSNFVGQIIGQLAGLMDGILGGISGALEGIGSALGSVNEMIDSLMDLFSCNKDNQEESIQEWNLLDGGMPVTVSFNTFNILDKARAVGEKFKAITKVPADVNDAVFNIDPRELWGTALGETTGIVGKCATGFGDNSTGPQPCGPPTVTFWGGKGRGGAQGNAVIDPETGYVSGIDVTAPGRYSQAPYVTIWDKCGGGRGAVAEAILGEVEVDVEVDGHFVGEFAPGSNTILGFHLLPLAPVTHRDELIGLEIAHIIDDNPYLDKPLLPEGTRIIGVNYEDNSLQLSNNFDIVEDPSLLLSTSGSQNVRFKIIGYEPDPTITTEENDFIVAVKHAPSQDTSQDHAQNVFVIDDRQKREITLERGKTYKFDQSLPSNGAILAAGFNELETVAGQDVAILAAQRTDLTDEQKAVFESFDLYTGSDIRTNWYEEIVLHPFRFSRKSDGIHNCDNRDIIETIPKGWGHVATWIINNSHQDKEDVWVLSDEEQGWGSLLQQYGVYPTNDNGQMVRDVTTHTGRWEVLISREIPGENGTMPLGTYTFEMQADNVGTLTFDNIYLGATDPIPMLRATSTNTETSFTKEHKVEFTYTNEEAGMRFLNEKTLEFDNDPLRDTGQQELVDDFDASSWLIIESGDAVFNEDGTITGTGLVTFNFRWRYLTIGEAKNRDGTGDRGLKSFTIKDASPFSSGTGGFTRDVTITPKWGRFEDGDFEKEAEDEDPGFIYTYNTHEHGEVVNLGPGKKVQTESDDLTVTPNLAQGPHRVSTIIDVEIFEYGTHVVEATIANTARELIEGMGENVTEFLKNPAALAWTLTSPNGHIVASSLDPFPVETTVEVSGCGEEYTDGVTKVGQPGKPGAYVGIEVQQDAPDTLYYYCENHSGMGSKINIIDSIVRDAHMGCRNARVEITAVNDRGSVMAMRLLNAGTDYREGTTNLMTEGGNGTSLTFDITRASQEGNIRQIMVRNGGKKYQVGDVVTPLCNFAPSTTVGIHTGVVAVAIQETGSGFKAWPNGDWGGMGRTWANRCQTIVHRGNGEWDMPYSEGDVITLLPGDCIRLPAQEEVCIDEDFDVTEIRGSQVIGERVTPRDMTDIDFIGEVGGRTWENATFLDTIFVKGQTYIERIDSSDPDHTSDIAQWWFYQNGEYLGTFIQDELSQVPQLIPDDIAAEGDNEALSDQDPVRSLIYRVGDPQGAAELSITIDPDEWMHVATELRRVNPDQWVLVADDGWSPFLQNFGVFPRINLGQGQSLEVQQTRGARGINDALAGIPQMGTWSIELESGGTYYFEVQADNQGSLTFDGTFLGSTTVFRSHNDSTFFEVDVEVNLDENGNPVPHILEATILNADVGFTRRAFLRNPAALAWVLRRGSAPRRVMEDVTENVWKEIRDTSHGIFYNGLKQVTDVRWSSKRKLEFDDRSRNGFDVNASLTIRSGDAEFVKSTKGDNTKYCDTIKGTGKITLEYSWADSVRRSGKALEYLEIEGIQGDRSTRIRWTQGDVHSGSVTKFVDLEDLVDYKEVPITTQRYRLLDEAGEIVATSLDPFRNITETQESLTRTIYSIDRYNPSVGISTSRPGEEIFRYDIELIYAETLGFTGCDIRNYIESEGIEVDEKMQELLDDPEWGKCADFSIVVTAPGCPTDPEECPPGYYYANGMCKPDPCPPGEHWDAEKQICVPDECSWDGDCPEGEVCINGKCVPETPEIPTDPEECPPGQHKVDGVCRDIGEGCPPGYKRNDQGLCIPIVPPICPISGGYRVITTLREIIVVNGGFNYNFCEDTVVIEPSHGAKAVIERTSSIPGVQNGVIVSIRVVDPGAGFTEIPDVYINTQTGFNATLVAVLDVHREDLNNQFPEGTTVLQMIDCVGNVEPNAKTEVT